MKISKHTPIVVNGKIIGAVAEDCDNEKCKAISVNLFLCHFEEETFTSVSGKKDIFALTATISIPIVPREDENF